MRLPVGLVQPHVRRPAAAATMGAMPSPAGSETEVAPAQVALAPFDRAVPLSLAAAVFLVQVALGGVLYAVFQEYVPGRPGASDAWGGYLLTAYGLARFLGETPTGAISDRIERKHAIIAGFAVMAPAVVALPAVDEARMYLVLAALLGLGTAFLWPGVYAIIADLYPVQRRGRAVGAVNLAQITGFGLGALAGALLIERTPGAVFAGCAFAVVLAALTTALFVPGYRDARPIARAAAASRWFTMLNRELAFVGAVLFISSGALAALVPAIRVYGDEELGVSFARLTVALIPAVVVGAALYLPAGVFADARGRARPLAAGQLLIAAGLLVVASTDRLGVASAAAVAVFAGNVLSVPALNAAVMDHARPEHRGAIIGFSVALTGLGLALGPATGGAVAERAGAPVTMTAVAAISVLVALAVIIRREVFALPRPVPRE